jgi:hypothetical protein
MADSGLRIGDRIESRKSNAVRGSDQSFQLGRRVRVGYVTEPLRLEPVVSGSVRLWLPQLVQNSVFLKKVGGTWVAAC